MSDSPQQPTPQQPQYAPQQPQYAPQSGAYPANAYPQQPGGAYPQPGSAYPQPGYPAQPAHGAQPTWGAQPGHVAQPGYVAQPAAGQASSGSLGRIAFIIAVIAAVLGQFFTVMTPFLLFGDGFGRSLFSAVNVSRGLLGVVLGAAALILGIIAARRRAQPVLAGIAIGVGALEVIGVVVSMLANAVYPLLY